MRTASGRGFSVGSSSDKTTALDTTNVAIDRDVTTGEGAAILDSILVNIDPSDQAMATIAEGHRQSFARLLSGQRGTLGDMLGFMDGVLLDLNEGRIRASDQSFRDLEQARDFVQSEADRGRLIYNLTDAAGARNSEFADNLAQGNFALTDRALDIVEGVSGDDTRQLVATILFMLTIYGLGALYLTRGR